MECGIPLLNTTSLDCLGYFPPLLFRNLRLSVGDWRFYVSAFWTSPDPSSYSGPELVTLVKRGN